MPYGLEGEHNKDQKLNAWMERCVESVKAKQSTKDAGRAIAICKAQLKKMKYNTKKASQYIALVVLEHIDEPWVTDEYAHIPNDIDHYGEEG